MDSTNSGINSPEISEFLALTYYSKPISSLCSLSQGEFVLLPGNKKLESFNKPQIKDLLDKLPHFIKSQFSKSQFKLYTIAYLQTKELQSAIDLDTVYDKIWIPTLNFISLIISSISDSTILLISIEKHLIVSEIALRESNMI